MYSYKEFLPWCQESQYISEGPSRSYGQLAIGFPPLLERYTATVLHNRPTAIRVSDWLQNVVRYVSVCLCLADNLDRW